jgi:hypothetical protein
MVIQGYKGGIIRGTAAEKSTVATDIPTNTIYIETDTKIIWLYQGSDVWEQAIAETSEEFDFNALEARVTTLETTVADQFVYGGTVTLDGGSDVIQIEHQLAGTPIVYWALPTSDDARGSPTFSVNGTYIILTYPTVTPAGTNNLGYVWGARL